MGFPSERAVAGRGPSGLNPNTKMCKNTDQLGRNSAVPIPRLNFQALSVVSISPAPWCGAALADQLQKQGAESLALPRDPPLGCPR